VAEDGNSGWVVYNAGGTGRRGQRATKRVPRGDDLDIVDREAVIFPRCPGKEIKRWLSHGLSHPDDTELACPTQPCWTG